MAFGLASDNNAERNRERSYFRPRRIGPSWDLLDDLKPLAQHLSLSGDRRDLRDNSENGSSVVLRQPRDQLRDRACVLSPTTFVFPEKGAERAAEQVGKLSQAMDRRNDDAGLNSGNCFLFQSQRVADPGLGVASGFALARDRAAHFVARCRISVVSASPAPLLFSQSIGRSFRLTTDQSNARHSGTK